MYKNITYVQSNSRNEVLVTRQYRELSIGQFNQYFLHLSQHLSRKLSDATELSLASHRKIKQSPLSEATMNNPRVGDNQTLGISHLGGYARV